MQHGGGTITIDAGVRADGAALSLGVADEGDGITGDPEAIFRRRHPDATGHGIGLALARSLTEAEGGRLRLARRDPTDFVAVLPAHRRRDPSRASRDGGAGSGSAPSVGHSVTVLSLQRFLPDAASVDVRRIVWGRASGGSPTAS